MNSYTHYWSNKTWDSNERDNEGYALVHDAANNFLERGVEEGDFIYVVTVKQGQLYVLGRMKVTEFLSYEEAWERLGDNIWDAFDHLIGEKETSTPQHYRRPPVPLEITKKLTFQTLEGSIKKLNFVTPGMLHQETLRSVRWLTEEGADLLDSLLEFSRWETNPNPVGRTIIDPPPPPPGPDKKVIIDVTGIPTGDRPSMTSGRVGQDKFSKAVRDNYEHRCCFPGCEITEDTFLRGAHIATWAKVPELRGHLSNGLCLCLMHDQAFEVGYFTLNEELQVVINPEKERESAWCRKQLKPFEGKPIKKAILASPTLSELKYHWMQIAFTPPRQEVPALTRYSEGDIVMHTLFGYGTVKLCEEKPHDQQLTIWFEDYGPKKIAASFAGLQKQA